MTDATSLQAFWDKAISRGLFPLAIARGSKAPIGSGWNQWTTPIAHPGAGSIGLRCTDNGLTAFDVDVGDPVLSHALLTAFKQVLGVNVPVRWGRRPRFLIPFYLADVPVTGRTFTFPNGEKLQLISGQFVAHGPHKDTGEPYAWENFDAVWPRMTNAQLQQVLDMVPRVAGTSLRFSADHEIADESDLAEAAPKNQDEWQTGRNEALRYLETLKRELTGKTEGRGSTIFALVGVLKFAEMHAMCTREEIESAILNAGQSLDEGIGGRTLGEEISRHDNLPVLRGNNIMLAIMSRRTMLQGLHDARTAPTLEMRTGFEISLEDNNDELPWIVYQRFLAGEVHFLNGHSGAGKSTILTDMVVSYLCGTPWLDADIERADGHVLWIAAEDDYGTERRVRHILRQLPNGPELAKRFHLIRGAVDPLVFEQQFTNQVATMAAMGMRVDIAALDTWGASGLCFKDNDTEDVLRAMGTLKRLAFNHKIAMVITDHLPLTEDENKWQKGNGAKSGNAGFMYRITAKGDLVSIDCGKARGAPKAKSYTGRVASETYGTDRKGRITTVNVFKRAEETRTTPVQSFEIRLAAMLPAVVKGDMDAVRSGAIVAFEDVAATVGNWLGRNTAPTHVASVATVQNAFGADGVRALTNSGHLITIKQCVLIYAPKQMQAVPATLGLWDIKPPEKGVDPLWG